MSWKTMDDFGDSDLLILGDGEDAQYVPMTEPVSVKDQWKNERARIVVIRCGDGELVDPAEWIAQDRVMGKREFKSYRALAQGREGKVMLMLHRTGAEGDLKTRYAVKMVRDLKKSEIAACQALLADYEKESK